MTVMLGELNRMGTADFAASIGDTFELAPWVAEAATARRPFATVSALHQAMMGALPRASGSSSSCAAIPISPARPPAQAP
jgi:2-oxo-4-hydroxy-4-carboxy-5-ureidoimidazoline decarboxylase